MVYIIIVNTQVSILTSVKFLGHTIGADGVRVDMQKIEAVKTCPRPTTHTEVHSFLELAGY